MSETNENQTGENLSAPNPEPETIIPPIFPAEIPTPKPEEKSTAPAQSIGEQARMGATITSRLIDYALTPLKTLAVEKTLAFLESWMITIGLGLCYFFMLLVMIAGIVVSAKMESFTAGIVPAIITFFICIVGNYIGFKMFPVLDNVLKRSSECKLSNGGVLQVLGVGYIIFGIAAFLLGSVAASELERITPFVFGLCILILCLYFACMAFRPAMLNITVSDTPAGIAEEAISLITFFMKSLLKLVPIAFFLGMTGLCITAISIICGKIELIATLTASAGIVGTLPLFAYFIFLVMYAFIDCIRAILSLSQKDSPLKK